MSTNNAKRRGGQGNNGGSKYSNGKSHSNGRGTKGNGNNNNNIKFSPKASSSSNSQGLTQQEDQDSKFKGQNTKETLGFLKAVIRLLVILVKGLVALLIFAIIFNLAAVTINKTLMDGKLGQYINVPSWADIFGGSNKRQWYT